MANGHRVPQQKRHRDRGSVLFGAFMAAALLVAAGLFWATTARGTHADDTYTATYTPQVAPEPEVTKFVRPEGRPTRAVFAGDSLMAGYYARTRAEGFHTLVKNGIGPVEDIAEARAHQTLSTVSSVTDVPPHLDLAVVELGTNDLGITPLDDFRTQYAALLNRVRSTSPNAAIVCMSVWSAGETRYNWAIKQECEKVAGTYVYISHLAGVPENRGPAGERTETGVSDNFHPNSTGHRAIADAVLTAIGLPQGSAA